MITVPRSVWDEPRPADIPPVGRFDWVLVGVLAAAALIEGIARPDLAWRPLVTVVALGLAPALLWRRERPLAAVLIGWGLTGLLALAQVITDAGELGLYSMMAVLILLYCLVRWGSGREIVIGTTFVAFVVVLGMCASSARWADILGGAVFLLSFVALAAVFRYRADLWQRQQREIRNEERIGLARELHDIVAHHVSAIAVQAQAGRVVAGTDPSKAVEALEAIESEASQTLAEMRSMVRVLRADEGASYAPQLGVANLLALTDAHATPTIEVGLHGALTRLAPAVDAALYRLAQESLTNALRHARGATRIVIQVSRDGDAIRLRVTDNGKVVPEPARDLGFGLRGMAERAELLGGSLSAGPRADGGWMVEAVLPVEVRA